MQKLIFYKWVQIFAYVDDTDIVRQLWAAIKEAFISWGSKGDEITN
jgi:hypothetical protein